MAAEDLKTLAPPKPGDTFGNTSKRRRTVTTGHAKRAVKGLVQMNVKVRSRARDRFETLFAAAAEKSPGLTKGDFMEAMIEAFRQGSPASVPAPSSDPAMPAPLPEDVRADRTVPMVLYATSELASAIERRAARMKWTVSATVEHACATAQKTEDAVA